MPDDSQLEDALASLRIDRGNSGAATPSERMRTSSRGEASFEASRSGAAGWLVGGIVAALLGVGGYLIFREGQGRLFPDEVELGAVTLVSPAAADVTLVATGYVYARKRATVAPKTVGRIARLLVDEGDQVKENQLMAELESADALAQLSQVRADIAAARARVDRSRADHTDAQLKFSREEALLQKGAGTQMSFDDAKARLDAAKALLQAADAELRAVEARQQAVQVVVDNTKVKAPFAGTVVRKLAEVGEVVPPTGGGVFNLASLDNLEVQADVSEAQFSRVKVGTPTEILLDAFPDRRFRGQVSEIRQTVDRAKAAVTVKVRFTDDSKGVLPDMAAKVSFLSKALDNEALKAAPKLVIPKDAIVTRSARKVALTIEDGRIHEVPLMLGPEAGSMVELKAGPPPGTQVVRRPDEKLGEGAPVKEKKK